MAFATATPCVAHAQPVVEARATPVSILNDLVKQGPIERVRSWPVNWNNDEQQDFVVQVAFWLGGNAVRVEHSIYVGHGAMFTPKNVLEIDHAIGSVTQTETGIEVETLFYIDGDGRCCPSGIRTLSFQP